MIVCILAAGAWEAFGSGLVALINFVLTIFCFACVPAFFGYIWMVIRKIKGEDDDITWSELFTGLVVLSIFSVLVVGIFGKMFLG